MSGVGYGNSVPGICGGMVEGRIACCGIEIPIPGGSVLPTGLSPMSETASDPMWCGITH